MFYSQFILAKKGPLGTIWIAAHLERKLRKNQVAETNIGVSVDSILFPEVPIALRLSGHLLLGVVRIYSKKVNYLFHDCSEALVKIKQAFHSTIVDLPPEAATAPFHSITLPETFDFDELELLQDPECSFVQSNGNFVDHNVTTREQITLQDPMEDIVYLGSSQFGLDERFVDGDSSPIGLDFDEDIFSGKLGSPVVRPSSPSVKEDIPPSTSGHGDEAVQMEMNDHHEPSTPVFDIDRTERDDPRGTSGLEQIRDDQQQNLCLPSPPLNCLEESDMARASSKDPDVFLSGNPTLSFNVLLPQAQQVFEARTPDLNKEFCPPDEPSTPALPEETSLPFEQETSLISGSQERLFPSSSGGFERARPDEHSYTLTNQASVVSPLGQSRQDVVVPAQSTLQHFPPLCGSDQSSAAMDLQQVSMAPQQLLNNSLIPQSATPSFLDQSFRLNPAQQPFDEFNRNASATAFQGFHQPASMQQLRAGVFCQSGQDLASSALFSSPMIDQHLSPFAGSEQSRAAMYPQQVSMPSQAQLSSILTSQNVSSSVFNQSLRLNAVEQGSSVETNRDASFAPFQGFPASSSMQQLTAGSFHQTRQDLCVPAQFSSSISEQHFAPFVGLQQSDAPVYPQQTNVLPQPHFHSMSINQKTPSFTDQNSVSSLVHKPSLVEANKDTNSTPFQGFPLPASLRQLMTGSYQNISLGTSNYLAPLAATNANHSMASLHQPFGKPSAALNHPWSSPMPNHEASSVFQQPGLLANPKTMFPMLMANNSTSLNHALASSIGTAESSSVFQEHSTIWDNQINMTDSIKRTFQSIPVASNLHSSLTSSGSFSPPAHELSTLAQTDSTVLNIGIPKSPINENFLAVQRNQEVTFAKENITSAAAQQQMALHGTHEVAVTKETVSPAATQHLVTSPAASLPFNLPSGSGMQKLQEQVTIHGIQEPAGIKEPQPSIELHHVGSPAGSLPSCLPSVLEREEGPRKAALHMSDIPACETLRSTAEALREEPEFFSVRNNLAMPALELDRSNAHAAKTNEKLKEVTHPTVDKTPPLREETPITATKRSPFSMRSFDSVPGDDDVLATILGRGTSAFKVLSTPKENPVAKRQRVVLRSSFKKRKIEFDTLTVLHGDLIRQQLANTEDIRRVRKKAPCTRQEIWSLDREIQGQQLFCEPSLPGLSTSLHDLYRAVLGVNGAKFSSSDLLKTSQDLLAVESENSRLVIEDRTGDSGRVIFEGRKEINSSEVPSEAICPPKNILREENVASMRKDDELTAEVLKESLNETLPREDLSAPLQFSEEAEEQVGRVQERISACEAELVHNMALDIEAREKGLQNGSQGQEEIYLQGPIFRRREEHMDVVEQKEAVHGVIENDVVQGLVDSVICNLMDVGKERNSLGVETNREIELITSQGDIGMETQGLVTHSGQELQGPRTDAQCAQVFRSFGTDVHGRQIDLPSLQTIPGAKEDVFSRQVDLQSLHALPNENQYVLSRQIDLQYLQATSNETHNFLNRQVNLQSLQATLNEKQDVLCREVDLPTSQAAPHILQAAANEMQDVLNRQVNLQSLQATPNEKQDVLSREVVLPTVQATPHILQAAPNEMQDVLNRQVNLQSLQATPSEMQDVLNTQVYLQSLQATPNEKQDVVSREVDLPTLQATPHILHAAPNEMQDVFNRRINLQSLQATRNEKQDVLSREADLPTLQAASNMLQAAPNEMQDALKRQVNLQSLQATPNEKQDAFNREVDLLNLQTAPNTLQALSNEKQDVLIREAGLQCLQTAPSANEDVVGREVNLQPLQAAPVVASRDVDLQYLQTTLGRKQDVLSMQVYLQALQTAQGAKQDVLCGQGDLQALQTTPGAEQDVVEIPSLSNAAIVVKDDDNEKMGDILEKSMDAHAHKEDQEFAFISDAKVTEFLTADNDMAYNELDDFATCASEELDSSIHDNNGWSARTRNVGRYLKTVFEGMEANSKRSGERCNPKLGLERLLMRKTRKEAARMFFETLVLKTREYIHVEQQNAFEDIQLYPSPKLMKTSF